MQSVVHVVSANESEHQTAFAITENLLESGEIDDVAVVAQAEGIHAVATDGEHVDRIRSLLAEGVAFSGCGNTLDARGMAESDLVEGVEVVSEGAVEVTRLQDEGYAYLRP